MLSKEKAIYQVKLILSYLSKEEYEMLPKDIIDYIEENYEYDEEIKIDSNIPLENQNIDQKSYELLEEIIKKVENSNKINETKEENLDFFNSDYDVKMTKITWEKLLNQLNDETAKNKKAKEMIESYIKIVKEKDLEIEKLKKANEDLYEYIKRVPRFIRKIFLKKDIVKLLDK